MGDPAVMVHLPISGEIWDDFATRVLHAAGIEGDAEDCALLDMYARLGELGPFGKSYWQTLCHLPLTGHLRVRAVSRPHGIRRRGGKGIARLRERCASHLGSGLRKSNVEMSAPLGFGSLLVLPRRTAHSIEAHYGPKTLLWVKAYVPGLRLLGASLLAWTETLACAGAADFHMLLGSVEASFGFTVIRDFRMRELEWWLEDDGNLKRLDRSIPIGQLDLCPGQVVIVHPAGSEKTCTELYADPDGRVPVRFQQPVQYEQRQQSHLIQREQPQRDPSDAASTASFDPIDLPVWRYKGGSGEDESCQICLERFESEAELKSLPCLHAFHAGCLDIWLQENISCPICRHELL